MRVKARDTAVVIVPPRSDVEEEDAVSADGTAKEDTDEAGGDVEAEAEPEPEADLGSQDMIDDPVRMYLREIGRVAPAHGQGRALSGAAYGVRHPGQEPGGRADLPRRPHAQGL